ncbi:M23 family peptidase [Nonomuraea mesophila]|uniref:M23 family peptidase n=1 Tax=Nonomuraea mesophila TaxID=2530382 RepID=A0A4R5EM33_9ACTN|nr:M23 family metallopeptidase [Nonomuraea mesophila]TDE35739.1 M23 family peptidase [Nonomuraea mesophila]
MVVTTALIAALGVFGAASPAMAAPDLQLPFPCGQKWQLNTWAHAPALDMVKEPDQRGTEGATLIAPAAGRVNRSFYHDNAGNMVQIDHGGGYFTTYIHLQSRSVSTGDRVQRGTVIGKVGKTGPTSNGHPHLHFELGYDSNGDGSASWGYKGSERVRPTINGVSYGQANGREWNNVESHNCPEPSPEGVASVYGVTPEGRLTYTAIDAATGRRTHGAVHSTATLGFTPKAMATLNFNTLLVTKDNDPGGKLYRVDIRTNRDTLTFDPPVYLASGYTHDLLAYDGKNHLYGIANGTLRRYTLTATKPTKTSITDNTVIGKGFTLKTLTTTAPGWLLGTTTQGELISYQIHGAGNWKRHQLRDTTWQVFDHLLSPGAGLYYGHHRDNSMHSYHDANPHDGRDDDLRKQTTVDTKGWSQTLLSAQPATVT